VSLDETQLRQLSVAYASAVDRRDAEALVRLFTPDATLTVVAEVESGRPDRQMHGTSEIARIPTSLGRYRRTFHMLGQSSYIIGEDSASGEVYCIAHHLQADDNYVMYIRYDDRYARPATGHWLIAERRVVVDWSERRPTL
jgi:ketosteroid isomerase-like protein